MEAAVLERKENKAPFVAHREGFHSSINGKVVETKDNMTVDEFRAEATQNRYVIPEDAYDLDIALDLVFTMWALKLRERDKVLDADKKQKLQEELDMMQFERNALYKNGEMQRSVMDKAFRLYSPIIKAHYASV